MSIRFIGNSSDLIDWFEVIDKIKNLSGKKISADRRLMSNPQYNELFEAWDKCEFNYNSAEWINFYAEEYGFTVEKTFADIVSTKHLRSWISKINPGFCAPWHWDIDDDELQYLENGKLKRFVCTIGETHPGHFSVIGSANLHDYNNGDIFLWDNYREWHAGMNAGLVPKFQYNYLGYEDSSTS